MEFGSDGVSADAASIHRLMVIAFAYRAEDIRGAFEHPLCMVGSDATTLANDGLLASTAFHGAYTWAGWYYRHFVRDTKIFKPEEAVRRITSLPASRLGLNDRGVIRQGVWADLAIFDPDTFAERGTTFEPNQYAAGMKHVLVNGVPAVTGGQLTGDRSGQVLRRM
jgi:N-acyl-D-amino-acid deacylase